jgi:hypothetical protein
VDLLITDASQIMIPGCAYTPDQLAELRAALEEHLRGLDRFLDTAPAGTSSHQRTIYHDRTGQRELAYIEHHRLTISAYTLSLDEAQDFYRLLTAVLGGDACPGVPELPRITPTPILFHNLSKTHA